MILQDLMKYIGEMIQFRMSGQGQRAGSYCELNAHITIIAASSHSLNLTKIIKCSVQRTAPPMAI